MTPVISLAYSPAPAALGRQQWSRRNGIVWMSCWACRIPVPRPLAPALIADARPSGSDRVTEGAWACEEPECHVAARLRLVGFYADGKDAA